MARTRPFKIALIGDQSVGKTKLVTRYVKEEFDESYISTYAAIYYNKKIDDIELLMWDTSGQERCRSIFPMYCRNATSIVICCSLTDKKSFDHIQGYLDYLKKSGCDGVAQIILVATKSDLVEKDNQDHVTPEKFLQRAQELGHIGIVTSAKNNENVNVVFETALKHYLNVSKSVKRETKSSVEPTHLPATSGQSTSIASRVRNFFKNHWGKILIGALVVGGLVAIGVFTFGIGIGVAAAAGAVVGGVVLGAGGGAATGALMDRFKRRRYSEIGEFVIVKSNISDTVITQRLDEANKDTQSSKKQVSKKEKKPSGETPDSEPEQELEKPIKLKLREEKNRDSGQKPPPSPNNRPK